MASSIDIETVNPNIRSMQYAVRGPLAIRATEIEQELKNNVGKKKFSEVIRANTGDSQAMGQPPITFIRQVLSLVVEPHLLEAVNYPDDVKNRVRALLNESRGRSIGSYTESLGLEMIRRQVAKFIEKRDQSSASFQDIILTAGATHGIKSILQLINCTVDGKKTGIMVPIPQYPLYSATIVEQGMHLIPYYLDEKRNWQLNIDELKRAIVENRGESVPRAIVVINPGNPTGQVLTQNNMKEIIKFAHKEGLIILADEVYQQNVYDDKVQFHSFKKVLVNMPNSFSNIPLASFMSCSKGYMGECGIRGGYVEVFNFPSEVKAAYYKLLSASVCPNTLGQVTVYCVVNPPTEEEPSYQLYIREKRAVLNSLKIRAALIYQMINSFQGFSCNPVQGSMYAFPRITLPAAAIKEAAKRGIEADELYTFELLENTGVCIIPGSGFGQKPGTYHFRTTILPPENKLKSMLEIVNEFHKAFVEKYK